ncbi:MAG: sulfatase, partial [Verrucomicrobiales bacterium]|nr:sulfatase [Verrucomicrobiales bacterium]
VMNGTVQKTQLFNLKKNPHELINEHNALNSDNSLLMNLSDIPKFNAKRKKMEALLLKEMKRLDDPYRLWDQPK